MSTTIDFTRIDNDINGNPRYVCHFLNLVNDKDDKEAGEGINRISNLYSIAVQKARKIGGKKYSTKRYGGGIVFQSYNIHDTEKSIKELLTP